MLLLAAALMDKTHVDVKDYGLVHTYPAELGFFVNPLRVQLFPLEFSQTLEFVS